ncbi:multicopper oxidase family protein [Caryophanon tenue]|uniref:Copper oxidase n=1 Tax=Caryophanon tenue TaxID=33978 RepID=A0A1C0YJ32_9BACL|nr:multicopper oxidase domain-containing protein [Caryophanon tenue]OCS87089.1 copper oxidase [Caryophanon tenue]
MKKVWTVAAMSLLLAACNVDEEQETSTAHGGHAQHGTYYHNEQLALLPNEGTQPLTFPPLLAPVSEQGNEVEYALTAQQGKMTFVDGVETATYGYNGEFLGPVLRLKDGQQVTIHLTNELDEATTFHWHGLEVAGDATDGGPHAVIEPGETQTITFTVDQQAATLWYHPHPMGKTAAQVYKGLAGLLYIDDAKSEALQLPHDYGINDFPLVLQDRTFVDGQIDYEAVANTMSTLGDTIMINGVVNPAMTAANEKVRLRILNGSNAMTYYLRFTDDLPFSLIATDGGFVNEAATMTTLTLGAGERAEIVVDLHDFVGQRVELLNGDTPLLPIDVTATRQAMDYDTTFNEIVLDDTLRTMEVTKTVTMEGMTENFLLNGKTFDHERIDFRQKQGDTEIWEIENIINEEGAMAHPFHIHGTQFLVVSVDGEEPDAAWQGYKDTITVQPNQKVRIAVRFPEKGIYMFHCHILEHEDVGMMGQIEVY